MGTPLGTTAAAGPPSIKLRNKGDYVDVAVVDIAKVPRYEFGTKEVKKNRNGDPMTQDKVTVVVIGGTGVITENKVDRPVVADEVATIYFAGRDRWDPDLDKTRTAEQFRSWSGAQETLPSGQLCCGDVVRWLFEDIVPGQGVEPRKVRTVRIRRPREGEEQRSARCEELRRQPVGVGASSGGYDPGDEPF